VRGNQKQMRRTLSRAAITLLELALACAITYAITTDALLTSSKRRTAAIAQTATIVALPTTIGIADPDLYVLSPDDVDRTLDLMRATGVSTVRILMPWAGIQPSQDVFDWGPVDTMVNAAVARGMGVLGILNSTPGWAVAPGAAPITGPPASPAAYGDFAGTVAARYNGKISAYEVWNEPNSALFWTSGPSGPSPAGYTDLLKAAYPKIKAADSSATVVGGALISVFGFFALSTDPVTFLNGMYAAGAKNYFDALSFHPYQYTTKFSEGGSLAFSPINQLTQLHQAMVNNGDAGKKIWATEYGEPTSATDEAGQAGYIGDMLTKWRTLPYAGPVFVYTTRDRNTGSSNPEDTFGIYRTDWTPKPAQQTIQSIVAGSA
jgi:hypothetical protein